MWNNGIGTLSTSIASLKPGTGSGQTDENRKTAEGSASRKLDAVEKTCTGDDDEECRTGGFTFRNNQKRYRYSEDTSSY
jgi:hypothetical protein